MADFDFLEGFDMDGDWGFIGQKKNYQKNNLNKQKQ